MVKDNLDTWDCFIGERFLKVIDVKSDMHPFICVGVEEIKKDDKTMVRLSFQSDQEDYIYDVNKANQKFMINAGLKSPRSAIGKKFFFTKTKANNPQTKQEVDTLRFCKIESV